MWRFINVMCFRKFAKSDYLLFLISVCLSLCLPLFLSARPSVCPHEPTRLPLNEFSRKLIFENFSKTCREKINVIKI